MTTSALAPHRGFQLPHGRRLWSWRSLPMFNRHPTSNEGAEGGLRGLRLQESPRRGAGSGELNHPCQLASGIPTVWAAPTVTLSINWLRRRLRGQQALSSALLLVGFKSKVIWRRGFVGGLISAQGGLGRKRLGTILESTETLRLAGPSRHLVPRPVLV